MLTIHPLHDCGNSPKNLLVQQATIAWICGDTDTLAAVLSDDVVLDVVGMHTSSGWEACLAALAQFTDTADTLTIGHVLSHGRSGAVDGQLIGQDGANYTFCHIYEFASAKGDRIKRCTAYWIATT